MRILEISEAQLGAVMERALASAPMECCGVLLGEVEGDRALVHLVVEAGNVAADPERGFEVDPQALASAQRRARQGGLAIVGYYHSHPGGRTTPSERDRAAAWPEASYLIVSMSGEAASRPRSWSLGPTGDLEEDDVLVTQAA